MDNSCRSGLFTLTFIVLVSSCLFVNTFELNAATANAGSVKDAKAIEQAYRKNPADSNNRFAYAEIAPCSTAIRLYTEITKSEKADDSLKAISFSRLGDYNYAHMNYLLSVENYRQAARKSSSPVFRHKWALASMAAGDIDAAQSLWYTLSLEYGDEFSDMANYYLGLLQIRKGNYQDAMSLFTKCGKPDPKQYWTIASLAGKLECASMLGLSEKAKEYSEQLKPFQKNLLEKDLLGLSAADTASLQSGPAKTDMASELDSVRSSLGLYTLQVGAFGSVENARNLQTKLSKEFRDVTMVEVKPGEQVFYRVRIGSFSSREDALKFASDSLAEAGLKYTVVEK
ncbi:MAG: SPOR domain-containing protein [Candidatus Gastranaerophilales bacterium]|nr:SPOR domain-containing protein [Candidatus Gastranaerophilales bacterium]